MLDIKYLRENPEEAQKGIATKGYAVDTARILVLDEEKRTLQQRVERVAAEKNAAGMMHWMKPLFKISFAAASSTSVFRPTIDPNADSGSQW